MRLRPASESNRLRMSSRSAPAQNARRAQQQYRPRPALPRARSRRASQSSSIAFTGGRASDRKGSLARELDHRTSMAAPRRQALDSDQARRVPVHNHGMLLESGTLAEHHRRCDALFEQARAAVAGPRRSRKGAARGPAQPFPLRRGARFSALRAGERPRRRDRVAMRAARRHARHSVDAWHCRPQPTAAATRPSSPRSSGLRRARGRRSACTRCSSECSE